MQARGSMRSGAAASCSSRTRGVRVWATAAPEVLPKAKACKPAVDSLYLFKWTRAPSSGNTEMTIKQLKALEKVSKDALWFAVKDAAAEQQHVLVVTNDRKTAKKYQLLELEGDAPVAVTLDGLPEPVQVPLPSIRSALQQRLMMEDSSDSSDSDEEDMMMPTNKMDKNKMDKKKDKNKMDKEDVLVPPETVPENPLAAQQAAALLSPAPMAPADGHGAGAGEVAELVLGMVTKQERRKLKDCVRDVERGAMTPAAMPATANMMMMEDTSSSSSSGSSESEDDEMDMTKATKKMDKKKKEKKEE